MAAVKPLKVTSAGKKSRFTSGDFLDLLHGGTGADMSATGPGAWWQASSGAAPSVGLLPLEHGGSGVDNSSGVQAWGALALASGSGAEQTGVGYGAGYSNLTGYSDFYGGYLAGYSDLGYSNTFVGAYSAYASQTGNNSCVYGRDAAKSSTAVDGSAIYGYRAAYLASFIQYDTVIGNSAMYYGGTACTTGERVIIGTSAGQRAPDRLVAIGANCGMLVTDAGGGGYQNTLIGYNCAHDSVDIYDCTFVGDSVGYGMLGVECTAMGAWALVGYGGSYELNGHTAIGSYASEHAIAGHYSTCVGRSVAKNCADNHASVVIGANAGINATYLYLDVIIGMDAGGSLNNGPSAGSRVVIGASAGPTCPPRTVLIGGSAGSLLDASGGGAYHNTCVGDQAGAHMVSATDCTYLGFLCGNDAENGSITMVGSSALQVGGTGDAVYLTGVGYATQVYQCGTNNTSIGAISLGLGSMAYLCTALGYGALCHAGSTDHCNYAVAVGDSALFYLDFANQMTAVGTSACYSYTDVNGVGGITAMGYLVNWAGTDGYYNTYVGSQCGAYDNGQSNTIMGNTAYYGANGASTASYLCGFGKNTFFYMVSGGYSVAVGYAACFYNETESYLVAVGDHAGYNGMGNGSVAIGANAGYSYTSSALTAVGYAACSSNVSGAGTYIGLSVAPHNEDGYSNTVVGESSLYGNHHGTNNSVFGHGCGLGEFSQSCIFGVQSGGYAGSGMTAGYMDLFGMYSGRLVTDAFDCAGFGRQCFYTMQTGSRNSAFGPSALLNIDGTTDNCGFGYSVGPDLLDGNGNCLFGSYCGQNLIHASYCFGVGYNTTFYDDSLDGQINILDTFEKRGATKSIVITTDATSYANSATVYVEGDFTDCFGYFTVFRDISGTVTTANFKFDARTSTVTHLAGDADLVDSAGSPGPGDVQFTISSNIIVITVGSSGACSMALFFDKIAKF